MLDAPFIANNSAFHDQRDQGIGSDLRAEKTQLFHAINFYCSILTLVSVSVSIYQWEIYLFFKKILKRARHAEVFEHILDNEILSRENIFEE